MRVLKHAPVELHSRAILGHKASFHDLATAWGHCSEKHGPWMSRVALGCDKLQKSPYLQRRQPSEFACGYCTVLHDRVTMDAQPHAATKQPGGPHPLTYQAFHVRGHLRRCLGLVPMITGTRRSRRRVRRGVSTFSHQDPHNHALRTCRPWPKRLS